MRLLNDQLTRHYHVLQRAVDSIGLKAECNIVSRLSGVNACRTVAVLRWDIIKSIYAEDKQIRQEPT